MQGSVMETKRQDQARWSSAWQDRPSVGRLTCSLPDCFCHFTSFPGHFRLFSSPAFYSLPATYMKWAPFESCMAPLSFSGYSLG